MNFLQNKINEKFPEEQIKVLDYTIMKEPAKVQCQKCGKIYTMKRAENFVRKDKARICRKCGITNKMMTKNDFQQQLNEKYPQEKLEVINFTKRDEPATVKCIRCGNTEKLNLAHSFLAKDKKRVCKHCLPNKRDQIENTRKKFKEWFSAQQSFTFSPDLDIDKLTSHSKISSTCVFCGETKERTMYGYLRNDKCSCLVNNKLKTQEEYQEWLGEEFTPMSEYKGMEHSILLRHNLCGFIYKRNARHPKCPRCSGSKGELRIMKWLEDNNIFYEREYMIELEGHKLRFDFYLPYQDIFIEYQGEQHFSPVEYFGGEKTFQRQLKYDNLKRQYCGNKLIEISYKDYDNIVNLLGSSTICKE